MTEFDWQQVQSIFRGVGAFLFVMYLTRRLFDLYINSQTCRTMREARDATRRF